LIAYNIKAKPWSGIASNFTLITPNSGSQFSAKCTEMIVQSPTSKSVFMIICPYDKGDMSVS